MMEVGQHLLQQPDSENIAAQRLRLTLALLLADGALAALGLRLRNYPSPRGSRY